MNGRTEYKSVHNWNNWIQLKQKVTNDAHHSRDDGFRVEHEYDQEGAENGEKMQIDPSIKTINNITREWIKQNVNDDDENSGSNGLQNKCNWIDTLGFRLAHFLMFIAQNISLVYAM